MFVVSQVDGEGYVLPDAFTDAVSKLYTEDSLKSLVKEIAPQSVTEGNLYVKDKCKFATDLAQIIPLESTPSVISISQNMLPHTAYFNLQTTFNFSAQIIINNYRTPM